MRGELICLGAIAGAYGVQGEARVKSFCAEPEAIWTYGPLQTEEGRQLTLAPGKPVSGGFACRLSGVATREQAQALKGTRLYATREVLPALEEGEFYHADLIGLAVFDPGGSQIGTLRSVDDHGAGDVLEIIGPGLKSAIMLPFTRLFVPTVDLPAGRIVIDPPEEEPEE